MTMMEICLSGLVGLNLYNVYRFRAKYRAAKKIAATAVAAMAKHERTMAAAANAVKCLVLICEKAGDDADAIRYKSLANRLLCGVGMAKKLEVL